MLRNPNWIVRPAYLKLTAGWQGGRLRLPALAGQPILPAHNPSCTLLRTQVALETAAAYQSQLASLPGLSPQGAAQLAADLEYFSNVLSTLGVAVPPSLAAWQAAAAAPPDGLAPLVEAAGDAAGRAAVLAVARLRGLQLGAASPGGA